MFCFLELLKNFGRSQKSWTFSTRTTGRRWPIAKSQSFRPNSSQPDLSPMSNRFVNKFLLWLLFLLYLQYILVFKQIDDFYLLGSSVGNWNLFTIKIYYWRHTGFLQFHIVSYFLSTARKRGNQSEASSSDKRIRRKISDGSSEERFSGAKRSLLWLRIWRWRRRWRRSNFLQLVFVLVKSHHNCGWENHFLLTLFLSAKNESMNPIIFIWYFF